MTTEAESERERDCKMTLLASKTEEEAMSQGMGAPLESWKVRESISSRVSRTNAALPTPSH